MTIFIDADGCPVVDLAITIAKEYDVPCLLLCDTSHVFQRKGAETITVSQGADSVDFALVNRVQAGDIVVTQDYGLAAMCLARCAVPIRQDGLAYSNDNIDALLHQRHTARKIRQSGGRLKGSSKRSAREDRAFAACLHELLSQPRGAM